MLVATFTKKKFLVVFGKFKKRNPCAIGFFRRILDRNVVVKQSYVALSTSKLEYVTACSASCEVVWLWKLLSDLFDLQMDATCIHCDN